MTVGRVFTPEKKLDHETPFRNCIIFHTTLVSLISCLKIPILHFLNNKCPRKGHWSLFCRNTTLFSFSLFPSNIVSFEFWPSFTFLGSFVPLLCLIACYVPHHSDSHHLLSHTLLWWPWPTPFGQTTHRFVRGICRNLYFYCVVSWPHIGAAK